MYLGPVHGSDHLRTRTWPFWTEPIVRFRVLQNPLKNRTEPNLTIPILTNQQLDKLVAVYIDFASHGSMLQDMCLSWILIQLGMSSSNLFYS